MSSPDDALPPVSLIISSRNRPRLLADTVDSIMAGDELPAQLVLIDQSDECHPEVAAGKARPGCTIRYVWTDDVGMCRGWNAGIAAADHDILVLADDDMFMAADWFGNLVRALVHAGRESVVTGQVRPGEPEVPGAFAPSTKEDQQPAEYSGRIGEDVLFTGNMAMYRHAVERIGGFDPRLAAAGDNDFGYRLLEAGFRILYVPEAIVYHRAWRTQGDLLRTRWNYGSGRGAYYAKHLSLRDRYMLGRLFDDVKIHLLAPLYGVRRDPRKALGDVALALGLIQGAGRWLMKQRRAR